MRFQLKDVPARIVLSLCLSAWLVCWPGEARSGQDDALRAAIKSRLNAPSGVVLPGNEKVLEPKMLRSFYEQRNYRPVWNSGRGFDARSRDLLSLLHTAPTVGLSPGFYHRRLLQRIVNTSYARYDTARKADIDLLFSDALLGFAGDLLYGRASRFDLKDSAIDAPENVDPVTVVADALSSGRLEDIVDKLAPVPEALHRLQQALSRLRSLKAKEEPFHLPGHTLHPGDSGGEVAALRRRLAFLGDLSEARNDGSRLMDAALVEAVKRFQSRHGLEEDGVVGRETRTALEVPISRRVMQVELNLDRWRWLPRNPGERYIVVNIAGQDLQVIEGDRATLDMRVIVGRPFQRTPSFASRIIAVVLNPYWEVPYSIAVKEILPKLRQDPGYLAREHMQVLVAGGGGDVLDPAAIAWERVPSRGFPYHFRQQPGPDNALGRVKFIIPNRFNVYLHDTPAKTLFSHARRCFSHGCVRLEKPFALADLLLHDEPGWSMERIDKTLETEKNYRIQLTRPMAVYLVYWTAWVDNKGVISFRSDVYGRDDRLRSTLDSMK